MSKHVRSCVKSRQASVSISLPPPTITCRSEAPSRFPSQRRDAAATMVGFTKGIPHSPSNQAPGSTAKSPITCMNRVPSCQGTKSVLATGKTNGTRQQVGTRDKLWLRTADSVPTPPKPQLISCVRPSSSSSVSFLVSCIHRVYLVRPRGQSWRKTMSRAALDDEYQDRLVEHDCRSSPT